MKDVKLSIKVEEEFRVNLQKLAKFKKYNGVSEMIRHEYENEIEALDNMAENKNDVFDFHSSMSELIDE